MHPQPNLSVLRKIRLLLGSQKKHYKRVEAECGISGPALWALAEIAEHPGVRVTDLARLLAVHQTTASNLLQRLESASLIERARAEHDQRVVRVQATPAGVALLARAPSPVRGVLQEALQRMPGDSLAALDGALSQLIGQLALVDAEAADRPLSEL